jgi:excinuclease UvrABC nuclease subunit
MLVMNLVDLVKIPEIEQIVWKQVTLGDHDSSGGIYRLKDEEGNVIYVGKSSNLHVRINNHMHSRSHIAYFVDEVKSIEWVEEPDPVYQTMLEAIFIAYHLPKYNDEIKDARRKFGEDYGTDCQPWEVS